MQNERSLDEIKLYKTRKVVKKMHFSKFFYIEKKDKEPRIASITSKNLLSSLYFL